jgi:hypothetical protein
MALTNASLTQGSSVTNTNNVITGTGVFDDLMESVTAHLEAQFQLGRITGTDFATVYLGAIQSALQASVSYALGQEKTNAEVELLAQKKVTEFGQTLQSTTTTPNANSILGKQITLYGEQAKGFKWNADQKYLKTILDAWAINISTAGVASTQVTALNATGTGNINTQITNAEPTG